jgi:hypothetical protein
MIVKWKSTGEITPDGGDLMTNKVTSLSESTSTKMCWDALHTGPPYLSGGPFSLLERETPNFSVQGQGHWNLGDYDEYGLRSLEYEGGFCNPYWNDNWDLQFIDGLLNFDPDAPGFMNNRDLRSLGNEAYNKLRPKLPVAGIAQAIAEGGDILPTLKTSAGGLASIWKGLTQRKRQASWKNGGWLMAPKEAANQYLNHQFGWVPLVNDVQKVCQVIIDNHEILQRKKAQNDKWIERKFAEQQIENEFLAGQYNFIGCSPADDYQFRRVVSSWQPYTITVQEIENVWYKGQFKYYYPQFDDNSWEAGFPALQAVHQQLSLLGTNVDPVLLYKLTPWTWMLDWFTDVGAGLQRLQDEIDNCVVSKYAYIMRDRTVRYRLRCRFSTDQGSRDLSWFLGGRLKSRESADGAFGFNLKPADYSPFQISILGALGLSRL